jgi:hypothetical protein
MKRLSHRAGAGGCRSRGVAMVELALLLTVFMFCLPCLILAGQVALHHMVLQKAAYQAARYMATVPRLQMLAPVGASQAIVAADALARQTVLAAGLPPLRGGAEGVEIFCMNAACFSPGPNVIRVRLRDVVDSGNWQGYASAMLGDPSYSLQVVVDLPYAN